MLTRLSYKSHVFYSDYNVNNIKHNTYVCDFEMHHCYPFFANLNNNVEVLSTFDNLILNLNSDTVSVSTDIPTIIV